eukprot:1161804-Pelagomonas_calceolata.AAC.3
MVSAAATHLNIAAPPRVLIRSSGASSSPSTSSSPSQLCVYLLDAPLTAPTPPPPRAAAAEDPTGGRTGGREQGNDPAPPCATTKAELLRADCVSPRGGGTAALPDLVVVVAMALLALRGEPSALLEARVREVEDARAMADPLPGAAVSAELAGNLKEVVRVRVCKMNLLVGLVNIQVRRRPD